MHVTAKVSGYHPATGLNLVKGEEYTIDPAAFAPDIFDAKFEDDDLSKPKNTKFKTDHL